jgi:hypothetical protein
MLYSQFGSQKISNILPGVSKVTVLAKREIVIKILESSTVSPLHPICETWSTILMSYVTAQEYCTAYPMLMGLKKAIVRPSYVEEHMEVGSAVVGVISHLTQNGFGFESPRSLQPGLIHPLDLCPYRWRSLPDSQCLLGGLRSFVNSPEINWRYRCPSFWRLGGFPCVDCGGSLKKIGKVFGPTSDLEAKVSSFILNETHGGNDIELDRLKIMTYNSIYGKSD